MGQGAELVTGISSLVSTPLFTAKIVGLLFWSSYRLIVKLNPFGSALLYATYRGRTELETRLRQTELQWTHKGTLTLPEPLRRIFR
jgi:hypothetical protein